MFLLLDIIDVLNLLSDKSLSIINLFPIVLRVHLLTRDKQNFHADCSDNFDHNGRASANIFPAQEANL